MLLVPFVRKKFHLRYERRPAEIAPVKRAIIPRNPRREYKVTVREARQTPLRTKSRVRIPIYNTIIVIEDSCYSAK